MAIKTKYLIGERFKNNDGFEYEIIGYCESNRKRKVKFDSGYETILSTNSIIKGNMQDFGRAPAFGLGIIGFKNASIHPLYWRWVNMIGRCYSEKHIHYKSYGAKGIKVEPYLMNFKNYVEFISTLDNYSELLKYPNEWQIDKDIKNDSCNNYFRENIKIVRREDNLEEENSRKRFKIKMIDENGNIIKVFESITVAEKETGIHRGNIARAVRGQSKTAGGYRWEKA